MMNQSDLDKEFDMYYSPGGSNANEDGYYHEYCRLYLANVALTSQVKDLIEDRHQLQMRLNKY